MPSLDTPTLVAEIRGRLRLSQQDLARRLDVSFATVNAWERGRTEPRRVHRLALDRLAAEIGIRQGVTVLVIDDDEDAVAFAVRRISASGPDVETVTATNGSDGLLLCGTLKPDLVLLDIRMPGIDGFAVADSLRRIAGLEHTVLYFVTGHLDEAIRERVGATAARGVREAADGGRRAGVPRPGRTWPGTGVASPPPERQDTV